MIAPDALIRKVRARWQLYVLQGRWQRADRIRRLLDRLDPAQMRLRRSA